MCNISSTNRACYIFNNFVSLFFTYFQNILFALLFVFSETPKNLPPHHIFTILLFFISIFTCKSFIKGLIYQNPKTNFNVCLVKKGHIFLHQNCLHIKFIFHLALDSPYQFVYNFFLIFIIFQSLLLFCKQLTLTQ